MTMRHLHRLTFVCLVCLLLAPETLGRIAVGQNRESDLIRENARLQAQVDELNRALEAAMRRIDSLEKKLAASPAGSTPSGGGTTSPVAAPPLSSPEGVITVIKNAYAEAASGGEIVPAGNPRDEAARAKHARSLQKWIASANRVHRQRVTWPVQVESVRPVDVSSADLVVTPWDPAAGKAVGDPFTMRIPARVRDRLQRLRPRENDQRLLVELDGVFTPTIRYNANRTEVGPFDNPRFIAPGAEMTWVLDFKSLGPLKSTESEP